MFDDPNELKYLLLSYCVLDFVKSYMVRLCSTCLACVGQRPKPFLIDRKPCLSCWSSLPLLGRWRPSSLYSSLCDSAGVCIFLLCSSSLFPLFSSCLLSPLSSHGHLSCTYFFLLWQENQTVTTLTHPELVHPHNPCCRTPHLKTQKPVWYKILHDLISTNALSSKREAIWCLFLCRSLPQSNASSVCSDRTQLTQSLSFNFPRFSII